MLEGKAWRWSSNTRGTEESFVMLEKKRATLYLIFFECVKACVPKETVCDEVNLRNAWFYICGDNKRVVEEVILKKFNSYEKEPKYSLKNQENS